jgi:hypothetical protein
MGLAEPPLPVVVDGERVYAWLRENRMVAWVMCARHARNAHRVRISVRTWESGRLRVQGFARANGPR